MEFTQSGKELDYGLRNWKGRKGGREGEREGRIEGEEGRKTQK